VKEPGILLPDLISWNTGSHVAPGFADRDHHGGRMDKLISRTAQALVLLTLLAYASPALPLDQAALQALLETIRTQNEMPGVRATVMCPDRTLIEGAAGLADVENNIPMDTTTPMPGGSTGKTFVAAVAMLLAEEGKLTPESRASQWLGDREWFTKLEYSDDIEIGHLLSHSSGVADYPGRPMFLAKMVWRVLRNGSAYFEPEELIGFAGRQALFEPGEAFAYSDVGYLILGRVIEAASDHSYHDLLRERILDPHGLTMVQPVTSLKLATPGYQGGVSTLREDGTPKLDPRTEWTGGGLNLTPTGLVLFYRLLADGQLVSPANLELMTEPMWCRPDNPASCYGYGLFVDDRGTMFSHSGMWAGYRTHVLHSRTHNLTVAIQTNRDGSVDMPGAGHQISTVALQGGCGDT